MGCGPCRDPKLLMRHMPVPRGLVQTSWHRHSGMPAGPPQSSVVNDYKDGALLVTQEYNPLPPFSSHLHLTSPFSRHKTVQRLKGPISTKCVQTNKLSAALQYRTVVQHSGCLRGKQVKTIKAQPGDGGWCMAPPTLPKN